MVPVVVDSNGKSVLAIWQRIISFVLLVFSCMPFLTAHADKHAIQEGPCHRIKWLHTKKIKNWETKKLNSPEPYKSVSLEWLPGHLAGEWYEWTCVTFDFAGYQVCHYWMLSREVQGRHFRPLLKKSLLDPSELKTPTLVSNVPILSEKYWRKSARFVTRAISTTMDWCHNSTLHIDDFTARRRRWRRCSMIYYRKPTEDT